MSLSCHMCELKTSSVFKASLNITELNMPNRKIVCLLCNNCTSLFNLVRNTVETNQKFIDECYKKIEKNKNK